VYNGDADAVSMLDELAFCYTKFWGDKKSKKEDKSDASNALLENLLSFASKPSQLYRRMRDQDFGVFAEQITADGLQSLISVSDYLFAYCVTKFLANDVVGSRSQGEPCWPARNV
jgi:DNA polymerase phi